MSSHDDPERVSSGSAHHGQSGLGFLKRLDSELTRNSDLAGLERALGLTVEHFEATSGVLLLSNRSELQNELQVVASCGKRGPAGWQQRAREAANDSEAVWFDPRRKTGVTSTNGISRGLVVSISTQGQLAGLLAMLRAGPNNGYTRDDLDLAELVGNHISVVLDQTRANQELNDAREAAHRAELQLERFAHDIRRTFESEKARANELAAALAELQETYRATVQGLAIAVEAKDAYTGGHIHRVTQYGLAMMRQLAPELADDPQFEYGFLLHDVGKLAVPDGVLKKEGPLDDEEWILMRSHAETGRRILEAIQFLGVAKEIVHSHHERWDGKGYPRGLRGEQIPLGARVFPVADSFDAMTSTRPYRQAMPSEDALAELTRGSGTQFWPPAVEAFARIPMDEIESIRASVRTT